MRVKEKSKIATTFTKNLDLNNLKPKLPKQHWAPFLAHWAPFIVKKT